MRFETIACILLLIMAGLATVPGASAGPLDDPPAGLLWRNDTDGGRTYQLQIDDPAEGDNLHTSLMSALPSEVQDNLDEALEDFGIYSHPWAGAPDPTTTHGVYAVTPERGLERYPIFIVEGSQEQDLIGTLLAEAVPGAVSLVVNQAPYAANYVMPTSLVLEIAFILISQETGVPLDGSAAGHPSQYPKLAGTYRDHPTIYIWQSRKVVTGEEVWQGWYLQREGQNQDLGPYALAERRAEFGPAVRTLDETVHAAGLYLEEKNERWSSTYATMMHQRFTIGATSQGIDVPLATVVASDEREDPSGNIVFYPQHQRTGYAIGVETPLGFVPLVGSYTEAETDWSSAMQPGTMHTRTTSIGVFVLGEYEPLVGMQYQGEYWPMDLWALIWATTGGPGTQFAGEWETSIGVFVLGEYEPVAGAQYRDDFPEAHYEHQMMIRFGVFTLGVFRPLVGVSYDGVTPLLIGLAPTQREWIVSSGVFVGEDYKPLIGVTYEPRVEGGTGAYQETYRIGVFPAEYDTFIPLAYVTWDGMSSSFMWLLHAPGGLGNPGYDTQVNTGATLLGSDEDLAGIEYRHDTPSGSPYHAFVTAGVFLMEDFIPLAGIAYCSSAPGTTGLEPTSQPAVIIGIFVGGSFTPLVRVQAQPDGTPTVQPLPGAQC